MKRAFIIALAALSLGLYLSPRAAAVQFTCAMSGSVSKTCCCAPRSDDGCASLTRSCSCCKVSISAPASVPATPSPAAQWTGPVLEGVVVPDSVRVGALVFETTAMVFASPRCSSPPTFILNQSIRC